jgi:drug/metabolite transporter (DMT)-like permease
MIFFFIMYIIYTHSYYNNVISIPLTAALGFAFGEFDNLGSLEWDNTQIGSLIASCVVGVGISYAGFNLRKLVTATSFTVIGVLCKVASVLLNILIWDKHANATGIAALCICILAGTFYQQSGKR